MAENGCYLVIDEAEALTAIDVNTGKYIGKDNLQETILNANIEAAHEIAKQLRLRDISGIIVIDFIDMESEESKQRVVDELTAALKDDRMKSNVLGMTELGLVQMTRKKTCRRLSALTQTVCPHCGGTGRILSFESMAMRLRREIIRQVKPEDDGVYLVEVNHKLASFIIAKSGENRHLLPAYKKARFFIRPNCDLHPEKISIRRISDHSELFGATAFS